MSRIIETTKGNGRRGLVAVLLCLCFGAIQVPVRASEAVDRTKLEKELKEAETAFARSMAERAPNDFAAFLSVEAIFIGQREALRGRAAVAAGWQRYFEEEKAPFSWAPERVEVLDSGTLGLTSGPVHDPEGNVVGTFNSVWRREDGRWKIVFDKGCPPCP